jgi:drug/metabolite transporter (DMT)-like permease
LREGAPARVSNPAVLYGLIALMVLFWSGNFIIGKIAVREFPPLLLSALRTILAALFTLPVHWWTRRNSEGSGPAWKRADLPQLILLGIFGVALNQIFFVTGLSLTSVAHSAIVISMTPMLVLLIAAASGHERLTLRKAGGMSLALAGVAILNLAPGSRSGGATPLGDFLTFLGGLTFALFTVWGRSLVRQYSPVAVNMVVYAAGAAILAPLLAWDTGDFAYGAVSAAAWASLIYMALFASVICYLIYFYALSRIPASRVAAFSYLQPLLATLMAVAILDEPVTLPLAAGGSVIFAGVYLTERG